MRLFKQRPQAATTTAVVAQARPLGTLPCSERGCSHTTGVQCAYTDRRGHHCDTAWCPEHMLVIDGRPYCRRHGGVVRAVTDDQVTGMPDLHNRAPSLLEWVAQRVDRELMAAVGELAVGDQRVQTDHARLVLLNQHGGERLRVWERTWKLYDHTGIHLLVALGVEEQSDSELVVRINATTVARLVPPWIASRRRGAALAGDADAAEHAAFYAHVVAVVRQNLGLRQLTR